MTEFLAHHNLTVQVEPNKDCLGRLTNAFASLVSTALAGLRAILK